MGRFRYGVCEWSLRARGRELLKAAAKAGLHCVQLGVGEEIFSGEGLGNPDMVEEYLAGAKEYNIEIDSLSPQFVDQYSFTMPQSRQEEQLVTNLIKEAIELSKVFGCRSFLLPVLCKNDICDGTTFHRAVKYIRRFSNLAAESGIKTYLEVNLSLERIHDLLDAVENPMVKIFFDSQNMYALNGTSMEAYFRGLGDLVGGIHLKDGIGSMLSGSLLGEGNSGFFKTAQAIIDSDYAGSLIIENVYTKATVCSLGTEAELLARDADLLHGIFDEA